MKTRESGMPDEALWETFFDPRCVLAALGFNAEVRSVVEFGCGYGTFTMAAAEFGATVTALDIDPQMVERTQARAVAAGLASVRCDLRDFVEHGSGLADDGVDYVMLFNILHAAEADRMLAEARRILKPGGLVGVMHWNYDPTTPRGPSMTIRPQPQELYLRVLNTGFDRLTQIVDLPPHHYGFVVRKPALN
jgi:SAM-dependent methyltransferase